MPDKDKDKKRKGRPPPVQLSGGSNLGPQRKQWNTGASFVPPKRKRSNDSDDAPPPRKKSSNRRLPTVKKIKEMVPKKSRSRKSLKVPTPEKEVPKALDKPEDGYWQHGQWVDLTPPEKDEPESASDEEEKTPSSADETSSRVIPPISGYRRSEAQRDINRATTSSSTHKPTPIIRKRQPLSPASLRILREVGESDDEPSQHKQEPLFLPKPPSSSSQEDLEDVEKEFPPSTYDRTFRSQINSTRSRTAEQPSRVFDSVSSRPSRPEVILVPDSSDIEAEPEEPEPEEVAEPHTDKENTSVSSRSKRLRTYGRRIKYGYSNPEPEPAYSQPMSQLPLQIPPGRNPALSRERAMSMRAEEREEEAGEQEQEDEQEHDDGPNPDHEQGLELEQEHEQNENESLPRQSQRTRRPLKDIAYYSDDENEEDDYAPGTMFSYDPDWDEEMKNMFATDSLESRTGHPPPVRMLPVSAAFRADKYSLPAGRRLPPPPPPRRPQHQYVPLFQDDQRARLMFTQTRLNLSLGEARNRPTLVRVRLPKRLVQHPQQRHATPGHDLRPLKTIQADELRAQHAYAGHRIPVDPRLLKYATYRPPRNPPRWRDPENRAAPRIVHPSDQQTQAVCSYASTVPSYYPVGRTAMYSKKQGNSVPGRAVLLFTALDPHTPPRLPTSVSTSQTVSSRPQPGQVSHASDSYRPSNTSSGVNAHPDPLSFNRSGTKTSGKTSGKATPKTSAPFIPQRPTNPPRPLRQPSQPSFVPYTPIAPEEPDDDGDDMIPILMDDGEEVLIPRRELEEINLVDLDRSLSRQQDEIDDSDFPASQPQPHGPSNPSNPPRKVFGDITSSVAPRAGLSGINMTDHLLSLASRAADKPVQRPQNAHERRLAEKRKRLEARRREAPSEATPPPQPAPPPSSSALVIPSQLIVNNFASRPAPPSQPLPVHPKRAKSHGARSSQATQPLVLPASLYPQQSVPPPAQASPPSRRSRSRSIVTSQYKPPTRLNATPPPEPTVEEEIRARLASVFPAYARAFVEPPAAPAPPPRLGVGLPARPLKSALKRSRTVV